VGLDEMREFGEAREGSAERTLGAVAAHEAEEVVLEADEVGVEEGLDGAVEALVSG